MVKQAKKLEKMSFQRSDCPIACALDVIGDKWTMLVVRDLFRGKQRFSEFMDAEESIKTNILSNRLKRLEDAGLLSKTPYQTNPPRYEYGLTSIGLDLLPLMKEMIRWSNRNMPGTSRPLKEN